MALIESTYDLATANKNKAHRKKQAITPNRRANRGP